LTFNERYENNFLAKLRTLPEPIFRECVFRVQDGESAIAVARWLLAIPNRGGMQSVNKLHTLRRYVEVLARHVLKLKMNVPPAAVTPKELQQIVEQERRRVDNEIAIAGGPLNGQVQLMINDMMNQHAKASDRRLWVRATAAVNLQRLQLAVYTEEKAKPIAEATKISQVIIQAAEADMRLELADLNVRKAKQDAENEDLYGAINCAGELVKGQPAAVNSGPAPGTQSAVAEPTYFVLPAMSEYIEALINISPAGRMITNAVIDSALELMYSADVWREMEEEEAQSMRPTAAGNNVENGTMRESQGAAAQACATQTSPEEPQEADTIASSGEGPRPAGEELEEFFPVLIKSSVADRRAVCGVLEAMLMITEAENVFRKEPQVADPAQESDASTISPRRHYYTSAENSELLQEMVTGAKSFSPVARMMCKRVLEIATKAAQQDLIARGALA
jgi:hypothetical protein